MYVTSVKDPCGILEFWFECEDLSRTLWNLANGEQKRRHVDHLRPRVETAEDNVPDWADVIPSETAAPQPSVDEPGGNGSGHALPMLHCSSQIRQAPEHFGHC